MEQLKPIDEIKPLPLFEEFLKEQEKESQQKEQTAEVDLDQFQNQTIMRDGGTWKVLSKDDEGKINLKCVSGNCSKDMEIAITPEEFAKCTSQPFNPEGSISNEKGKGDGE